jgi:HD-GYP domain-containing protein (c-di-GMP phosphodiesterase class II)
MKAIYIESLRPEEVVSFSLYLRYGSKYVLYKAEGNVFTQSDKDRLIENDTTHLFIDDFKILDYNTYINENISKILSDTNMDSKVKGQLLYQTSGFYFEESFLGHSVEDVDRYEHLVEHIITFWLSDPNIVVNLANLIKHTNYEYGHSLQVAALSVILAEESYTLLKEEVLDIGVGAILHDLGKMFIPSSILDKPTILTDAELKIIQEHPIKTYNLLKEKVSLDKTALMILLDHHEYLDGTGYPNKKKDQDIGRNARIVTIADIYCALTSDRPYRPAFTEKQALYIMQQEFKGKLDLKIFETLKAYVNKKLNNL